MAELVAAIGCSHFPWISGMVDLMPQMVPPDNWRDIKRDFGILRDILAEADTVICVSNEHFVSVDPSQIYPTFMVVNAERGVGPSEPWLPSMPRNSVDVEMNAPLANHLLEFGIENEFDLTKMATVELEHGFLAALEYLTPKWDKKYIWILQNCFFPPRPTMKRCYDFGKMLRKAIDSWDSDEKIAIVATGGLVHRAGTPDMDRPVDFEAFDRQFIGMLEENTGSMCALSDAELNSWGNGTHEYRNWTTVAGAVAGTPGKLLHYSTTNPAGGMCMVNFDLGR